VTTLRLQSRYTVALVYVKYLRVTEVERDRHRDGEVTMMVIMMVAVTGSDHDATDRAAGGPP
jgi:hypothetical protein